MLEVQFAEIKGVYECKDLKGVESIAENFLDEDDYYEPSLEYIYNTKDETYISQEKLLKFEEILWKVIFGMREEADSEQRERFLNQTEGYY